MSFVEIEVADTGCGIDAEVLPRVFEPFFTTKPNGLGTGLGLSQVYGFATQSGGSVAINSELGRGTRITVRLPRSQETEPAVQPEEGERAPLRLNLLIVDDNVEVALAVKNMAMALGCTVTVADSPAKALSDLAAGRFGVLLTDLAMPGLSGMELAKAARMADRGLGIVLMSGYPHSFELRDAGLELLRKPFSPAGLEAALRRAASGERDVAGRPGALPFTPAPASSAPFARPAERGAASTPRERPPATASRCPFARGRFIEHGADLFSPAPLACRVCSGGLRWRRAAPGGRWRSGNSRS